MIVLGPKHRMTAIVAAAFVIATANAMAASTEQSSDASSKVADNSAHNPLAVRFENTVVVTGANTVKTKLNYNEDGTLTVSQADGALKTAKWTHASGQFCVAFVGGATRCGTLGNEPEALVLSALRARADAKADSEQNAAKGAGTDPAKVKSVGDTWTMTLPGGEKLNVRILAGR